MAFFLRSTILLVFIWGFFYVDHSPAQDTIPENQPKIGLVLSGGAAKGFAHIGVLKVLEEVGIYPDYITGTSMGAIIGGLYSLGYSSSDITEMVNQTNWNKILTDQVSMNKIVMEEKPIADRFLIKFPIRNYEFKLPSGLNEGYQLEKLFADLTWGATGISQFDSLSIPFHCMAVDIIDGQLIEFDSGNLPTAMRASMGIPGIFAPTQKDSMVLVDGGVIRNFPVQEVKDMGADIVIGVYVGIERNVTPEDLFSLSDIISRTTLLSGVFDAKKQMGNTDFLIKPNMNDVKAADFMIGNKIINHGEIAAREMYDRLKKLVDSLNLRSEPPEKLDGPKEVYISEVDAANLRYVNKPFLIGKGGIFSNQYVTKKDIEKAVERIFGTRYFKKVGYELERQGPNQYKLIYRVKESTRAFVKGSLHYDNQRGAGLILNTTFRNYLIQDSRFNITANIAENPGVRANIYQYFGKRQNVMGRYSFLLNRNDLPVFYQGDDVGNFLHQSLQAGVGLGYNFNINRQIGLDLFYEKSSIFPGEAVQSIISSANFENYKLGGFTLRAFYEYNTLNDYYFPTKGVKIQSIFQRTFQPISSYRIEDDQSLDEQIFSLNLEPFNNFYFQVENYTPVGNFFSFKLGSSIGLSSAKAPITSHYALGGLMPEDNFKYQNFSGFTFGEQISSNYLKISGMANFHINPRIFLTLSGDVGLFPDRPNQVYSDIIYSGWSDYVKGYAVGLRLNSILGPLTFMVGDINTSNHLSWYLNLGYTF